MQFSFELLNPMLYTELSQSKTMKSRLNCQVLLYELQYYKILFISDTYKCCDTIFPTHNATAINRSLNITDTLDSYGNGNEKQLAPALIVIYSHTHNNNGFYELHVKLGKCLFFFEFLRRVYNYSLSFMRTN